RLMALSEVAWGTSNPDDFAAFESRVIRHFKLLDEKNINYAKSIYNVSGNVVNAGKGIAYELKSFRNPDNIRYTINGEIPIIDSKKYIQPIPVNQSRTMQSAYFENGELKSAISSQDFRISKSTRKSITLKDQPSPNYASNGAKTQVDGVIGNPKVVGKTRLGFSGQDVVATIDLGEKTDFEVAAFNSLDNKGSWIHLAKSGKIYLSDDGEKFEEIKEISSKEIIDSKGKVEIQIGKQSTRFLKIIIENAGIIPAGFPGAGRSE